MSLLSPPRPGSRHTTGLPPLVVAVHGTRSPDGSAVYAQLIEGLARRLPEVEVRIGWVDLHRPPLVDTLAEVGPCVVVPAFLAPGYHVGHDIPAAARDAGAGAVVTELIGPDLVAVAAARLNELATEVDAVVLAAAGSRWAEGALAVHQAATGLEQLIRRPVRAGFVTAAQPTVAEAVADLRRAGHRRVAAVTWLLVPGEFSDRVNQAGADVVTAPLGVHPGVLDTIVERYGAAALRVAAG